MKIKVYCKEGNRPLYEEMLKRGGFTVSPDGDLTFAEVNSVPDYLIGKANEDNMLIYLKDIVLIETCGRDIVARTAAGAFRLKETLEHLESLLKVAGFIRVSQSTILQRSSIERISPGLSMRFHLTLKNGIRTDVTRSYYYSFKDFIGL